MPIIKSNLAVKQSQSKYDPILPCDFKGRVRVMAGEVEVTDTSAQVILGYLPAGEGRVLGGQSSITGTLTASGTTLSLGLGSYTPIKGGPIIAADEDVLQTAKTLAASDFDASKGAGVRYSAGVEVPVIAKASADLAVGDKLSFSILYVID